MKIVRMVDFFERKFERKEENDFGMLFGITGLCWVVYGLF